MKNSIQCSVRTPYLGGKAQWKRFIYCAALVAGCVLAACGGKPKTTVKNDSLRENPLMQNLSEQEQEELRKIIGAIPVPFEIMNKVSGSGLPYRKELLNPESNVPHYNTAEGQAVNIGIYGADMAYMIAFERLGESGTYLRSIRTLADAVVIPSVFNEAVVKKYQADSNREDSLRKMMSSSYTKIDSTLQGNERFGLAALVVTGGWIESLYLTTQQINGEARSESNKLLYDMLDEQQKHTDDIASMLALFPGDSLFAALHKDIAGYKKGSSPAAGYTAEELAAVTAQVAAIRTKLVNIQ